MKDARTNPGFLHLTELGKGGGKWLHMCISHVDTSEFLMETAGLDDLIVNAMTEEGTRSRIRVREDGIMVLLKAMHLRDTGMAAPEDMVSIRIWIDPGRVITTREADVDPFIEIARQLGAGGGPSSPGAFLSALVTEHLDELGSHIEGVEDAVNRIESLVAEHRSEQACPAMAETQMRISGFLRHLSPQRPVLEALSTVDHPVLDNRDRARMDDGLNDLLRYLETLDDLRARIDILNDQVARIQDRKLNRSSYAFAVAAMLFLPLGVITGMFGVNVAGIPLAGNPAGFWLLAGFSAMLALVLLVVFRWRT